MGLCVLVGAEGRWGDLSEQVSSFHVLTLYKEVLGAQKIQPWESETTPAESSAYIWRTALAQKRCSSHQIMRMVISFHFAWTAQMSKN